MAFCPQCGAAVDGRFCQKCGAGVDAGVGQASGYVPPPRAGTLDASGIPSNVASALCYVVQIICPVIFLVVDPFKNDRKIRFDAFQSIFLTVFYVAVQIAIGIVAGVSWQLGWQLGRLVHLGEFILIVFLAIKAFQNQKVVLPVIGPLAEKQA
jgi:uncharacterized membrane protein